MFKLIALKPACAGAHDDSDSTLNDALQTIFSLEDRVVLQWNDLEFQLCYKYDIGVMIDDIVEMILSLEKADAGAFQVDWPSSGFPYHWSVNWNGSEVEVLARARNEPGAEDLTGRERIKVERTYFVRAWRMLLNSVLSCLRASGYSSEQIEGLRRLQAAATGGS